MCKTRRRLRLPPPLVLTSNEPPLTGRKLIAWLKAQGAEPIPRKERERLRKAGLLEMPEE